METQRLVKPLKKALILFKKRGLFILPLALTLFLLIFYFSPALLLYLEKRFQLKLVFFSVGEPLLSLLRFSLTLTFIILFPLAYLGLLFLLNELLNLKKKFFFLFYLLGVFLFYAGILFAYFITLPYGIKFLLSFKTESLEPGISLSHFVNFTSFFLISFGLIFELPLYLILLSLLRILQPERLSKYRKEIFFVIVVFSAVITPTPDAINMSLLAIPLYVLFEVGLFLGKLVKKFSIREEVLQKEPQQEEPPYQEA